MACSLTVQQALAPVLTQFHDFLLMILSCFLKQFKCCQTANIVQEQTKQITITKAVKQSSLVQPLKSTHMVLVCALMWCKLVLQAMRK